MSVDGVLGAGFAALPPKEKLRRAATELEAVVLTQLLAAMRETVPEGGLFEESSSNEIFRSMLDQELARSTAAKSPFGLADAVMKQFDAAFKVPHGAAEAPIGGAGVRPGTFRRIG